MEAEDLFQIIEKTYESMRAGEYGFAINAGYYDFDKEKILPPGQGKKVTQESKEIGYNNLLESYKHSIVLESMCLLYQENYNPPSDVDEFLEEAKRVKKLGEEFINLLREDNRPKRDSLLKFFKLIKKWSN